MSVFCHAHFMRHGPGRGAGKPEGRQLCPHRWRLRFSLWSASFAHHFLFFYHLFLHHYFSLNPIFFSAAYFLLFSLSTPLIPLQYLPMHFPLSLPPASISLCSPHFESVILPSPSILSQVSPSLISLPCLAYLPRACIVSVSITDSVAVAHSPGHWDLQ